MTREEAIKAIKAWDFLNNDEKEVIETLIPELAESEDERIRKELLSVFQESEDSLYMGLTPHKRESIIAWLEKQGEHAKFRNKIQIGDKVTRNQDGVLVNLSQLKRVAKKDEKQGEQKPILDFKAKDWYVSKVDGKIHNICHSIDKMVDDYANNKERGNEEFGKPVPCMIRAYRQGLNDAIEKVILKRTWSEEDEKMLDDAIGAIGAADYYTYDDKQEIENWLKSLRPQNRWKPSDEQVDMLAKVCSTLHLTTGENEIMESIYDALKKLKVIKL